MASRLREKSSKPKVSLKAPKKTQKAKVKKLETAGKPSSTVQFSYQDILIDLATCTLAKNRSGSQNFSMVKIEVFHTPASDGSFPEETVGHLNPIITERAVALFCSTSNYRWEIDPAVSSGEYARLIKISDGREILSEPIIFLRECNPSKFEDILVEASFKVAQIEKEENQRGNLESEDGAEERRRLF